MKRRTREHAPHEFTIHKKDNSFKFMVAIFFLISSIILVITYNLIIWIITAFAGLVISVFGLRNIIWFITEKHHQLGLPKISSFFVWHKNFLLLKSKKNNIDTYYDNKNNFLNHHNYYQKISLKKRYYTHTIISLLKQSLIGSWAYTFGVIIIFLEFGLPSINTIKNIYLIFLAISIYVIFLIFFIEIRRGKKVLYMGKVNNIKYYYQKGDKIFFY